MAVPEILLITKDVSDFVDEIDDTYIRTQLQVLIAIAQEPKAPGTYSRDVALTEKATELWKAANVRQKASINRLLEERQVNLQAISNMQEQIDMYRSALDAEKAGPE